MPRAVTRKKAPRAKSPQDAEMIRGAMLAWFRGGHRTMPWRAVPGTSANAYHVLVSEAMLQQTQVATVIDYFNRFVAALPTVEALAAADEQQVLRLWQGLGYYRRARHLHAAARHIVERCGGVIPDTLDALLELPGVGRYTAGAIASIAFARSVPILDGNVARVIARVRAIDEPINQPAVREKLWAVAQAWVPPAGGGAFNDPGDFNQAMMELGATVCTPRSPRCLSCPLQGGCGALSMGRAQAYPVVEKRKAPTPVTHRILAVSRGDKRLLARRRDEGLWAGMWQQPTFEDVAADDVAGALATLVYERHGVSVEAVELVTHFEHMTTHRRIRFEVWQGRWVGGRLKAGEWRDAQGWRELPMPNPQTRALVLL